MKHARYVLEKRYHFIKKICANIVKMILIWWHPRSSSAQHSARPGIEISVQGQKPLAIGMTGYRESR
jgi:hypothetical protein